MGLSRILLGLTWGIFLRIPDCDYETKISQIPIIGMTASVLRRSGGAGEGGQSKCPSLLGPRHQSTDYADRGRCNGGWPQSMLLIPCGRRLQLFQPCRLSKPLGQCDRRGFSLRLCFIRGHVKLLNVFTCIGAEYTGSSLAKLSKSLDTADGQNPA